MKKGFSSKIKVPFILFITAATLYRDIIIQWDSSKGSDTPLLIHDENVMI